MKKIKCPNCQAVINPETLEAVYDGKEHGSDEIKKCREENEALKKRIKELEESRKEPPAKKGFFDGW